MAVLGGCSVSLWGCRPWDAGALPTEATGLGGGYRAGVGIVLPRACWLTLPPPTPPLVPVLVVQCVTEVETRGLTEVGAGAVEAVMPWSPRG